MLLTRHSQFCVVSVQEGDMLQDTKELYLLRNLALSRSLGR